MDDEEHIEAGGLVDENTVTLAVYGEELEPVEVSRLLGRDPSEAHRRGEVRREGMQPYPRGAWMLQARGKDPLGPQQLTERLLASVSDSPEVWRGLGERFDLQLRFGIFQACWNRGFDISNELLAHLSSLGLRLVFDIYCDGEEEGDS